jgi:FolB domain-containing protein
VRRRTTIGLHELSVSCIIGARAAERETEQTVLISFELEYESPPARDELDAALDYSGAATRVAAVAREGRFVLLESLARAVADELSRSAGVGAGRVECRKPGARPDAAYSLSVVEWGRDSA